VRETIVSLSLSPDVVADLLAVLQALPPAVTARTPVHQIALTLLRGRPTGEREREREAGGRLTVLQVVLGLTEDAVASHGVVLTGEEEERLARLARRDREERLVAERAGKGTVAAEPTVLAGGERVTVSAAFARRRELARRRDRFVVSGEDLPLLGAPPTLVSSTVTAVARELAAERARLARGEGLEGGRPDDGQAARGVRLNISRTGLTHLDLSQADWQALGELVWDAAPRGATVGSIRDSRAPTEVQPFRTVQVRSLTPDLGLATNLRSLCLANQGLTSLPPEIGSLRSLRSLWLPNNKLRWLPDTVGNLRELRRLVLSENDLLALPTTLACCAVSHGGSLTSLTLDYNPHLAYPPLPLVARGGEGLTKMLDWMLAHPAASPGAQSTLVRRLGRSLASAEHGEVVHLPDGTTLPFALLWARARAREATVGSPRTLASLPPTIRRLLTAIWDQSTARVTAILADLLTASERSTIVRYVTGASLAEPTADAIDLLAAFSGHRWPWVNADEQLLDRLHADFARLLSFPPDLYLTVGEGQPLLPAHRFLLAAQSSFFAALFSTDSSWARTSSSSSSSFSLPTITVPDTTADALAAFLALAYAPDTQHTIDGSVVADAVVLADRLGAESVRYSLETVLLTDCLAPRVALNLLLLARHAHLPRLRSVVDHYLTTHFESVLAEDPTWDSLQPEEAQEMERRYGEQRRRSRQASRALTA
jgi:hypothetical protein